MLRQNRRLASSAKALGLSICMAFGAAGSSSAQSPSDQQAEPRATQTVELPPLLIDLFRSTPSGPDAVPEIGQPAGQPAGPPNPPAPGSSAPALSTSGDFTPDEVLVTINGDANDVQQIAADLGLQIRSSRTSFLLGTSIVRFGIPDGRSVGAVLAQLQQDGRAADSGANHIYTLQQAALVKGYALEKIDFDVSQANGSGIRIAVIDTARDVKHPALSGVTFDDFNALPEVPVRDAGHATSIIGLIAGGDGFQGLAPGARILHARAFENGKSSLDAILAALDWAAGQDAQIINMSFAGPRNRLFETACANALHRGIMLVAAAGNDGPKAPAAFPGAYESVIAVTATDEANKRMEQANVGAYVRISAPGVGVMAPIPGGGYDLVTGTSFAAAIYTGAMANLMRREPQKSGLDIEKAFTASALDLGEKGRDVEFGFGLIDVAGALGAP